MDRIKLICADIDGTLLDDNRRVLPQVKESLRNVAESGVRIALASGRMPAGVELVEKELGIPCIKICNAGTCILLGNQCITMKYLLPDVMEHIYVDIAKKNNLPLWIFREREWYVTDVDSFVERETEIIKYQPKVVKVRKLADEWSQEGTGPCKLLIAADADILKRIQQEIKEQNWKDVDLACSADHLLEIFPQGVTKATALSAVCSMLDIEPKDTLAIGDHELDIPMIEMAGIGVAMGNAISELKEKADYVTKTNNEAGVAYALDIIWHR